LQKNSARGAPFPLPLVDALILFLLSGVCL
jgi:hypothetical protein